MASSKPSGAFCTSCGSELDDSSRDAHVCVEERKAAPKPYGDVEYADPKNGKYPVDTEKHAKAAWAYINMPKNADEYPLNGVTLSSVKAKIEAALKKFGVTISEENSAALALEWRTELRDDPDGIEWAAMRLAIVRIQAGDDEGAIKALQDALPEGDEDVNDSDDSERAEPVDATPEIDPETLREYLSRAWDEK